MTPLPPEHVAQRRPDWRALVETAQAAARAPEDELTAQALQAMAERAAGDRKGHGAWASPFGDTRDQYVGASLIWLAKAYGRQGSEAMRQTLALALEHMALAFLGRLERAAAKLEPREAAAAPIAPVIPLRRLPYADDSAGED